MGWRRPAISSRRSWRKPIPLVAVARNLVVRVPDGVSSADASTVTLGAIALQGVRRAAPTLGETFVVIGLGILGQLTQQLLHANGVRVIGLDLDRRRLDLALSHGMEAAFHPDDGKVADHVARAKFIELMTNQMAAPNGANALTARAVWKV